MYVKITSIKQLIESYSHQGVRFFKKKKSVYEECTEKICTLSDSKLNLLLTQGIYITKLTMKNYIILILISLTFFASCTHPDSERKKLRISRGLSINSDTTRTIIYRAINIDNRTIEAVSYIQPAGATILLYRMGDTVNVGLYGMIDSNTPYSSKYLLKERIK